MQANRVRAPEYSPFPAASCRGAAAAESVKLKPEFLIGRYVKQISHLAAVERKPLINKISDFQRLRQTPDYRCSGTEPDANVSQQIRRFQSADLGIRCSPLDLIFAQLPASCRKCVEGKAGIDPEACRLAKRNGHAVDSQRLRRQILQRKQKRRLWKLLTQNGEAQPNRIGCIRPFSCPWLEHFAASLLHAQPPAQRAVELQNFILRTEQFFVQPECRPIQRQHVRLIETETGRGAKEDRLGLRRKGKGRERTLFAAKAHCAHRTRCKADRNAAVSHRERIYSPVPAVPQFSV